MRDSECLRAVKEIDQAIDSVQQNANGHQNKVGSDSSATALPNGEVSGLDPKSTTGGAVADSESCSNRALIYAVEAAAVLGVVCVGVIIAVLETRPTTSGRQADFWTEMAMHLRGQPFVASFNEYVYAPIRGFFIGEGN